MNRLIPLILLTLIAPARAETPEQLIERTRLEAVRSINATATASKAAVDLMRTELAKAREVIAESRESIQRLHKLVPEGAILLEPGDDIAEVMKQARPNGGRFLFIRGEVYSMPSPIASQFPSNVTLEAIGRGSRPVLVAPAGFANHFHGVSRNVVIRGLEIVPVLEGIRETSALGIRVIGGIENWTIEDCEIAGFATNISIQGRDGRPVRDVQILSSRILDAWSRDSHSQGVYAHGVDGLLIEGNLLDHNGQLAGQGAFGHDLFNHALYLSWQNTRVRVVGNVIARSPSHGCQLRNGGQVTGNLFMDNALHLTVHGQYSVVENNIFAMARDFPDGTPRGMTIEVGHDYGPDGTIAGAMIRGNVGVLANGRYPLIMVGSQMTAPVEIIGNVADGTYPAVIDVAEGAENNVIAADNGRISIDRERVAATLHGLLEGLRAEHVSVADAIAQAREVIQP